ncbi:hypothetical protein WJX73_003157 [Symbiochloris irregularis]|uniref:Uncharacterized protein n=1 Tax=Symbiochloris irregularis TaxID=706552 RepID=A0AAW1PTC9_9CHLO
MAAHNCQSHARRSMLGCRPPVQRALVRRSSRQRLSVVVHAAETKAFIWDCDGVIIDSEEFHRLAYNASFQHSDVKVDGKVSDWSVKYYDELQNSIGGGKAKMRHYFNTNSWPSSKILPDVPQTDDEKTALIDELQDWKTTHYQEIVATKAEARPNVLRLFDEAKDMGLKMAVCSAATKSSAIAVVENLLGAERYRNLDVFMAGDDVPEKKPDPSIYRIAAERMGLDPSECLVIEDSTIGVQAATGAGMKCIVTYTHSTADQDFAGAARVMSQIADDLHMTDLLKDIREGKRLDDRKS